MEVRAGLNAGCDSPPFAPRGGCRKFRMRIGRPKGKGIKRGLTKCGCKSRRPIFGGEEMKIEFDTDRDIRACFRCYNCDKILLDVLCIFFLFGGYAIPIQDMGVGHRCPEYSWGFGTVVILTFEEIKEGIRTVISLETGLELTGDGREEKEELPDVHKRKGASEAQ